MHPKSFVIGICSFLSLFLAGHAHAHFDVLPGIFNNKILTNGYDDEEQVGESNVLVFGYDFGEVIGDPYNIQDPGFNTQGSSAFAGGSTLRYIARQYAGRYLSYWDGNGAPNFGAVPAGISLNLYGSPTRLITLTESSAVYAPASPASLLIGTFAGNGAMHTHLTSSIFWNGDQTDGTIPDGLYAMAFTLTNPGTGVADSDTRYIVFNNGLTEAQHDLGIAYFAAVAAVPEPGTWALIVCGLGAVGFWGGKKLRRQIPAAL